MSGSESLHRLRVDLPALAPDGPVASVALITLDRPEVLNALDAETMRQLVEALEGLDADDACRAVVITGAGERAFAAGADIREMAEATPTSLARANSFARWERIRRIRKPIVAAVRGYALGGGCELAMACDLLVAADDAIFGQPEIKLGVMPGAGGTQRLTRALGKARAMDVILTGRNVTAREAEAHGLVTQLVPREAVVPAALELAARDRGHAAAGSDGRQGGRQPRLRAVARGWPRVRATQLLPALRDRGSAGGDGRLRGQARA